MRRQVPAGLRASQESLATKASRAEPPKSKDKDREAEREREREASAPAPAAAARNGSVENGHTSRSLDEESDARPSDDVALRGGRKMPQPGGARRSMHLALADDTGRVAQLEAEVVALRKRELELKHSVASLEEELRAQTEAAEAARAEVDELQAKTKDPKRDLDKLQQLTKVQEEVRRLRGEAREAREQRDQALLAQKGMEEKVEQLVKGQEALKLAGLEQVNAKLLRQVESGAFKLDDLEEENRELRHYIDRLLVQLLELDPKAIERAALPGTPGK